MHARAATTAVFFLNGLGIGAWAASVPLFRLRFGLDDAHLAIVLFALATGAVLSMPIAGVLVVRYGSGAQTRVAALIFASALAGPLVARTLPQLIVAAFILGASNGLLDIAMNAHASALEKHLGAAIMSSFHAAFSVGAASGALASFALVGLVRDASSVLGVAAIAGVLVASASFSSLRGGERTRGARFALPNGAALPLCAAALLGMLCEGAASDWSGVYLATVTHASTALLSLGFGTVACAMLAGRLAGDAVVLRFGDRNVLTASAGLACAGFALVALDPQLAVSVTGFALLGLGLANIVPVLYSVSGRIGTSAASGIATTATAGYAGFLAGPPIVGAIASVVGLRVAFVALAALLAIVATIVRRVAVRAVPN